MNPIDKMLEVTPRESLPTLDTLNAKSLSEKNFPPLEWLVENFITAGLILLVGSPKVGKSFLALQLAIHIASGKDVFNLKTQKSSVLYLSLEDSHRRLKGRLKMLNIDEYPDNLEFVTDLPDEMNPNQLVPMLEQYLDEQSASGVVGCIFIDTLQRARRDAGNDSYAADTEFMAPFQKLAMQRDVSIVMLHHTRKSEDSDPFLMISGSQGLMGVADTSMVIMSSRGTPDRIIHITGRDIQEQQLAFSFVNGVWDLLGEAGEIQLSNERKKILAALRMSTSEMTPKQLSNITGVPYYSLKNMLPKMVKDVYVEKPAKGKYRKRSNLLNINTGGNVVSGSAKNEGVQ